MTSGKKGINMDLFVNYYYEMYKNFMCLQGVKLPVIMTQEFDEQIESQNKEVLLYVNEDELRNPFITLHINSKFHLYTKHFKISKLYHEFTHIVDANINLKEYEDENYSLLMNTYSEFHASQVESAFNLGFDNINNIYKIDIENITIESEQENDKVSLYYLKPFVQACNIITKNKNEYYNLDAYDYCKKYKYFVTNLMYYLGKMTFCNSCATKPHKSITEDNTGTFYPVISLFEKSLIANSYPHILKACDIMWNYYKNYFKSSVLMELPERF